MSLSNLFPSLDLKHLQSNRSASQQLPNENYHTSKLKQSKSIPQQGDLFSPQITSTAVTQGALKSRVNTINQIEPRKRLSLMNGLSNKEVFQTLSNKLDEHQTQIDQRNQAIDQLEQHILFFKTELMSERNALQEKTEQVVKLTESNDKLNQKLKTTTIKQEYQSVLSQNESYNISFSQQKRLDETQSRVISMDVELKSLKENDKQSQLREQVLIKKVTELEAKLNATQQESKQKQKNEKSELNDKIQGLLKQIHTLQESAKQSTETIKQLEKDKLTSCAEALELRQRCQTFKSDIEAIQLEHAKHKEDEKSSEGELNFIKKQLQESLKKSNQIEEIKLKSEKALQESNKNIANLQESLRKLTSDNQRVSKAEKDAVDEVAVLKEYIGKKDSTLAALQDQLIALKSTNKNELDAAKNSLALVKANEKEFKTALQSLDKGEEELLKSLKCNYCQKFIKEPITVIPCGHSFCLGCKKAYAKDCIKCGPKLKVEAMYRNELLDDIIAMCKTIQNVKENLMSFSKSLK